MGPGLISWTGHVRARLYCQQGTLGRESTRIFGDNTSKLCMMQRRCEKTIDISKLSYARTKCYITLVHVTVKHKKTENKATASQKAFTKKRLQKEIMEIEEEQNKNRIRADDDRFPDLSNKLK